jgi:hypothetical protein
MPGLWRSGAKQINQPAKTFDFCFAKIRVESGKWKVEIKIYTLRSTLYTLQNRLAIL